MLVTMATRGKAVAPLVVQGPDEEDNERVGHVPLPSVDQLQELMGAARVNNVASSRSHRSRKSASTLSAREINASVVNKPAIPNPKSSVQPSVAPELVIEQPSEAEPAAATGSVPLPPLETLPAHSRSVPLALQNSQINSMAQSTPPSMIVDEGHSSLAQQIDLQLPLPTAAFESDADRVEAAFEEMVDRVPRERSQRPLVVLDGANVGWHHGHHEFFSIAGLTHAIHDLTTQYDVDIVAFLPASYFRSRPTYRQSRSLQDSYPSTPNDALPNALQHDTLDSLTSKATVAHVEREEEDEHRHVLEELHRLYRLGLVVPVPAGDHDDAYILHYARSHHGFVVSNDQYRDYIASMTVQSIQWSMQLWLRDNRCGYAFVGDELVLNPSSTFSLTLLHHNHRCLRAQDVSTREVSLTRHPLSLDEHHHVDQQHQVMDVSEGGSSVLLFQGQRQTSTAPSVAIPVTEWMTLSVTGAPPGGLWTPDALALITNAAAQCFAQHRPSELRHMLLARISLLLQMGRVREAEADWAFAHTYLSLPPPPTAVATTAAATSYRPNGSNTNTNSSSSSSNSGHESGSLDAELQHYWSLIRAYQEHGMDTDDL